MTYEAKVKLYRAGLYMFKPPPVPHAAWGEADWIRYIDAHGRWIDAAPR